MTDFTELDRFPGDDPEAGDLAVLGGEYDGWEAAVTK